MCVLRMGVFHTCGWVMYMRVGLWVCVRACVRVLHALAHVRGRWPQGDIMHFIAVGLRPRIKADVQYMLHSAHLPLSDAGAYVDKVLGPLLDDPDAATSTHAAADDSACVFLCVLDLGVLLAA